MVRLLVSDENKEEMSNTPYEIIRTECREENIDEIYSLCEKAKALFVGPGLGRTKKVFSFLSKIFSKINTPLVIDADALFYLSENKNKIPPKSILTPHRKEMLRLLGWEELKNEKEFLIACKEFTEKFDVTLVLKGAPTFVFHPKSPTFILPYGDPGMATAGSGDVLTGIIAALLSQGVECFQAALLGVYLHGVAGEKAAVEKTSYSMISSDIIKQLQFAFKKMICGSSYL
jgi:NAD(P)H-hydrate epimerase